MEKKIIALGVFKEGLQGLAISKGADTYPFRSVVSNKSFRTAETVLDVARQAAENADKIIFCLDGLAFPYNEELQFEKGNFTKPFTFLELDAVVNSDTLLGKTEFCLKGEMLNKEVALNLINLPLNKSLAPEEVNYLFATSRLTQFVSGNSIINKTTFYDAKSKISKRSSCVLHPDNRADYISKEVQEEKG